MGMRRNATHAPARQRWGEKERMHGFARLDPLIFAVRAGMIVRPGYGIGLWIVASSAFRVGFRVARVKLVRRTHPLQCAQARPDILMISGGEQTPALPLETVDPPGVRRAEAVATVDRNQPELVETRVVEAATASFDMGASRSNGASAPRTRRVFAPARYRPRIASSTRAVRRW